METAGWALQRSIYAALIGDAALTTLLGGTHVYDHVPRGTDFPYITIGQTTERDWSSGNEEGSEHTLTLHIWSRAAGRKEVQTIMAAVRTRLHDQTLALAGYRLVNIRHEFSDLRRETDGETLRGLMRFRAVTEALT
ncbi:MAG: DUF3168 domain-containing protein [Pseudomonadota bacterium]